MNKILALFGLLACTGALVRMALGDARRRRLDAWLQDRWAALRALFRPRQPRRDAHRDAASEADALIRRAAEGRSAKPPRKLH